MIYPAVLPDAAASTSYGQTLTLSLKTDAPVTSARSANAGASATATVQQTIGMGLTAFAIVEGSLPKGMILQADGRLGGKPSHAGTSRFTVEAEDENGYVSRRSYVLKVENRDRRRGH